MFNFLPAAKADRSSRAQSCWRGKSIVKVSKYCPMSTKPIYNRNLVPMIYIGYIEFNFSVTSCDQSQNFVKLLEIFKKLSSNDTHMKERVDFQCEQMVTDVTRCKQM